MLRDSAKGNVEESALKAFPEETSGPVFLLTGEKQEKRQPLSAAQAHRLPLPVPHTFFASTNPGGEL